MNKEKNTKEIIVSICVIAGLSVLALGAGFFVGRKDEQSDYNYMLDNDGMYNGIDKIDITIPDITKITLTADEVLKNSTAIQNSPRGLAANIEMYANTMLGSTDAGKKEIVDDGDFILYEEKIVVDGISIYGDATVKTMDVEKEDKLAKYFVGKKIDEEFKIEVQAGKENEEYAGKDGIAYIKIKEIKRRDYTQTKYVENNLDKIHEIYPNVNTTEEFLNMAKLSMAQTELGNYYDYMLTNSDIEIPQKYINAEMDRVKVRLNELGYSFSDYLIETRKTEAQFEEECKKRATQNILLMKLYEKIRGRGVADEEVANFVGSEINEMEIKEDMPFHKFEYIQTYVKDYLISVTEVVLEK